LNTISTFGSLLDAFADDWRPVGNDKFSDLARSQDAHTERTGGAGDWRPEVPPDLPDEEPSTRTEIRQVKGTCKPGQTKEDTGCTPASEQRQQVSRRSGRGDTSGGDIGEEADTSGGDFGSVGTFASDNEVKRVADKVQTEPAPSDAKTKKEREEAPPFEETAGTGSKGFRAWLKAKIGVPRYKQWCGPGPALKHGNCDELEGGGATPDPENTVDAACKAHDVEYCKCDADWRAGVIGHPAATQCTYDADRRLTATLREAEPSLPTRRQRVASKVIRGYFGLKSRVHRLRNRVSNQAGALSDPVPAGAFGDPVPAGVVEEEDSEDWEPIAFAFDPNT
jgi:hypothetical protein